VRSGKIEIATIMTVTLSCDHRVVDGALGAEFSAPFKALIRAPGDDGRAYLVPAKRSRAGRARSEAGQPETCNMPRMRRR